MNTKNTINSEVLFQKMGNTWYAFTEIEGEMFFRALPQGLDPRNTKIEFTQIIHDIHQEMRREKELAA